MPSVSPVSAAGGGRFSTLLQQLLEAHISEVAALQQEVSSLRSDQEYHTQQEAGLCAQQDQTEETNRREGATLKAQVSSLSRDSSDHYQTGHGSDSIGNGSTDDPPGTSYKQARTTQSLAGNFGDSEQSSLGPPSIPFQGASQKLMQLTPKSTTPRGLTHIRDSKVNVNLKRGQRTLRTFLRHLVTNYVFDAVFCVLIFVNAIMIAVEVQYDSIDVGFALEFPGLYEPKEAMWPGARGLLAACSWIFGVVFCIEVILRMMGLGHEFFCDLWNGIDLVVCIFWVVSEMEASIEMPMNSQLFRLARLGKLLRLIRLVRKIQGFDSLFIMTTAIRYSVAALCWTFVLLTMVQMLLALLVCRCLHLFYFDNDWYSLDQRRDVFTYFGSFTRALFSMFELTLANWPPAIRLLAENVSEWWFVFGVSHKFVIGFAIIGVINGVFIQETFKVASMDDEFMVRQKSRLANLHVQKMKHFLAEADRLEGIDSGDGMISRDEWHDIISDPHIKLWLASLEIDTRDGARVFALLDEDGDGQLSLDELVLGVLKVRGNARSLDLIHLMSEHQSLRKDIEALGNKLERQNGRHVITSDHASVFQV